MPFTKVYIHYVWATKGRKPLITQELKPILLKHIKENSIKKGIFIDTINCMPDHIHMLISLGKDQTIAKLAPLVKGESSFWINKNKFIPGKFEWQDDYFAGSVAYDKVTDVRAYIGGQEEHHKKIDFKMEYESFLHENNFEQVLAKANGKNSEDVGLKPKK